MLQRNILRKEKWLPTTKEVREAEKARRLDWRPLRIVKGLVPKLENEET